MYNTGGQYLPPGPFTPVANRAALLRSLLAQGRPGQLGQAAQPMPIQSPGAVETGGSNPPFYGIIPGGVRVPTGVPPVMPIPQDSPTGNTAPNFPFTPPHPLVLQSILGALNSTAPHPVVNHIHSVDAAHQLARALAGRIGGTLRGARYR